MGIKVSDFQANTWRKDTIQKLKQDVKQKTSVRKLDRIKKKKSKCKTYQDEKKKRSSGTSFSYESGGGARTLTEARDNREVREAEISTTATESHHTTSTTVTTWSQTDPHIFKLKQNQIKNYL